MGFAFDYDKAFINPKIVVVCIRSSTDKNCFLQKSSTTNVTAALNVTKVQLHAPLIDPTPIHKLELIKTIEEEKDIHVISELKN